KHHADTEPHPAHELPESSPGCTGSACSAAACRCPGCRAGGDRTLFLAGGPPTGAGPSITLLALAVLATVAQLRAAGAARGGKTGRPLRAQSPLGQRLGGRWLYPPRDPPPVGLLKCNHHPGKGEPSWDCLRLCSWGAC